MTIDNHEAIAGTITLNGYTDDKVVTAKDDPDFPFDPVDGGRHGDKFGNSQSMFFHNRNSDKTAPLYIETAPENYIDAMILQQAEIDSGEAVEVAGLSDAQIAEYWAIYEGFGAVVPERVLRAPAGSRGDVRESATWSDGVWTAEYQRKLVTGYDDDVQFDDLTKPYYFATTIMDNSGGENHDLRDTLETLVFEEFVPISGLPEETDYVGSETCKTCHPDKYDQWQRSIHSKMIQDVVSTPDAVVGDFSIESPNRPYGLDEVVMTLGTRYRQRYITKTDEDYFILDGQWNISKQTWDNASGGKSWTDQCAGCHTTGYNPESKTWVEVSIGCETCHGPGSEHVATLSKDKIVKSPDDQICGQCHTRGVSPDGEHGYPIGYRPGGELEGKFNPSAYTPENFSETDWWSDGHAKKHRQQYLEWINSGHGRSLEAIKSSSHGSEHCLGCHSADYILASEDAKPTLEEAQFSITCVTCHEAHSDSTQPFDELLRGESYEICTSCHNGGGEATPGSTVHHPMKEMFEGFGAIGVEADPSPHFAASTSGGPVCASCHMVGTAKSADVGDIASHNWAIVEPGHAAEGEPDSCTTCHRGSQTVMQNTIEERQGKVKAQLALLQSALDTAKPTMEDTDVYKAAYTNMTFVQSEGSYGIHNYDYALQILKTSFENLTGTDINLVEELSSYTVSLSAGLNMISLPLQPEMPMTAKSLAEKTGATAVITYDTARGRFVGYTPVATNEGFSLEGGKGYIVNAKEAAKVVFKGTAWSDTETPLAAPAQASTGWAFVVAGTLFDEDAAPVDAMGYTAIAVNRRTGAIAIDDVGSGGDGIFHTVWADLSRNSVVKVGDEIVVTIKDTRGVIAAKPKPYRVSAEAIKLAMLRLNVTLGDIIPETTVLAQNYPNPFNPETWVPYQLSESADNVTLRIFNAKGQLVRSFHLGHKDAGVYMNRDRAVYWNGKNDSGESVANGVYFYQLQASSFVQTKKMVLLK